LLNGTKLWIVFERMRSVFGMYLHAKATLMNRSMILLQEKVIGFSINIPAVQRALIFKGGHVAFTSMALDRNDLKTLCAERRKLTCKVLN